MDETDARSDRNKVGEHLETGSVPELPMAIFDLVAHGHDGRLSFTKDFSTARKRREHQFWAPGRQ